MTGELRINAVELYANRDVAAALATPGYMSTLVGMLPKVYLVSPFPTSALEGFFALSTKTCTECGIEKELSDFYADKRNKDGVRSHCKTCVIGESRKYRIGHIEHVRAYKSEWWQTYKVKAKDKIRAQHAAYYTQNREQELDRCRAYQAAHREENKRHCKEYYAANVERERQRVLRWHKEHPEMHRAADARRRARMLQAGGEHTAEDIKRQCNVQKWRCWWCGKKCKKQYHVDHLIPLAQGGHNGPGNIVIACPRCNLSKHDNLPSDWAGKLF